MMYLKQITVTFFALLVGTSAFVQPTVLSTRADGRFRFSTVAMVFEK